MIDFQRKILGDDVRNALFAEALRRVIRPGMTVVDIGAGTGYLSFLARKMGAKECILIEQSEALQLAQKIARANRITGCRFMDAHSTEVELPPCADLLFSETLGNFALEEHLLENLMDAKRFLKPNGILLPQELRQFVAPITNGKTLSEIDIWRKIRGELDFEPARTLALQNLYVETVRPDDLLQEMESAQCFDTAHFLGKESSLRRGSAEWRIPSRSTIYGFGLWWECTLVAGVILSTSPVAASTHWEQIVLPLLEPLHCMHGDLLRLHLDSDTRYHTGLRVQWEVSVRRMGKIIARRKMDTHRGELEE